MKIEEFTSLVGLLAQSYAQEHKYGDKHYVYSVTTDYAGAVRILTTWGAVREMLPELTWKDVDISGVIPGHVLVNYKGAQYACIAPEGLTERLHDTIKELLNDANT